MKFEKLLAEVPHEVISVPAKTILLEAGKVSRRIYVVRSGCIRQWYSAKGKDITCQFFFEQSPIASIESLVNHTPSDYTLESVLPTEMYVFRGEDVMLWIEQHPEQMKELLHFFVGRMLSYSKLFLSRIKETPQERYEALIKHHPEIVARIPQHYIASYLGISAVSLSRIRARR